MTLQQQRDKWEGIVKERTTVLTTLMLDPMNPEILIANAKLRYAKTILKCIQEKIEEEKTDEQRE